VSYYAELNPFSYLVKLCRRQVDALLGKNPGKGIRETETSPGKAFFFL
jgi:hypothetical protein